MNSSLMCTCLHSRLRFRHTPALQPQTLARALGNAITARKFTGTKWCTRISQQVRIPEYCCSWGCWGSYSKMKPKHWYQPSLSWECTLFGSKLETKCNWTSMCSCVIKFLSLNPSHTYCIIMQFLQLLKSPQKLILVFSIACSEAAVGENASPQHWPCALLFSRRHYFSGQQPRDPGQSSSRCYDACSSASGLANEGAETTEHESTKAKLETVASVFIFFIMLKTGLCCRLSKTREKIFKNTDRCLPLFRQREKDRYALLMLQRTSSHCIKHVLKLTYHNHLCYIALWTSVFCWIFHFDKNYKVQIMPHVVFWLYMLLKWNCLVIKFVSLQSCKRHERSTNKEINNTKILVKYVRDRDPN